jgi:catechol 2,3-dioxygenase-like lactoylglutathione lyase family enzyme
MTIRGIDHINISTPKLDETVAFFCDVLGLTVGWRPEFGVPGAWLYSGETAIVHLIKRDKARVESSASALDHFAFRIDDFDETARRLDAAGVAYQRFDVPGTQIRQINVRDLNGVNIELNCRPGP